MPQSKPTQLAMSGQIQRPLKEQERIDNALSQMAIRLDRVLTETVINQWHADLARCPVQAIEYAADCCGRNLERWPKLKQFMEAVGAWMSNQEQSAAETSIPDRQEIARRREEFQAWYQSPDAAELRSMVQSLDRKMSMGRPKLYTPEQLEEFRKAKQ